MIKSDADKRAATLRLSSEDWGSISGAQKKVYADTAPARAEQNPREEIAWFILSFCPVVRVLAYGRCLAPFTQSSC
jgi:hypothetical protein